MSFKTETALFVALTLMLPATFNSCVNEDYDLTKDIDKTIRIDGDISAPIGDSETILVDDLLDLDSDDSGTLSLDRNDNYTLTFMGNRTETKFTVPSFSIANDLVTEGGLKADINRDDILSELRVPGIPHLDNMPIPKGIIITRTFEPSNTPLEINQEIPEEITDIKDVNGNATARIAFSTNTGKATVSGLTIEFPDYLKISDVVANNINCTFDKVNNILRFGQVEISKTLRKVSVNIAGLDFSKIPSGQGFLAKEHKILLDDNIVLSGFDVKILSDDLGSSFNDIPEKVQIDLDIRIASLDIKDITVKVDPKVGINPQAVNVGKLPDFVNGDGAVLDLYNPQIMLFLGNDSPLSMNLNADLESYKGASKNSVHIGDKGGATDKVTVEANMTSKVYLSRTGEDAPSGYQNVKVPNLSDIVRNVPEKIAIADIDVKAADEFITVQTDKSYTFYCSYSVIAPLAFGKDLSIDYSSDFDGWNKTFNPEDVDLDINSAEITFDFVNMIPLGIKLTASAIDKEDNVIPGITVSLDGKVSSGSIEKPSKTPMTLNLKSSAGEMRKLDGIRMNLKITGADNDHLGICLNKNQGIRMENMKIKLQGAIITEL